jgi:hypothetical protein
MVGVYKEGIPQLGLFLVNGTEDAPQDGRYHIQLHGVVQASFASEKRARAAYKELRDRLKAETGFTTNFSAPSAKEVLQREAHEAALSEDHRQRRQANVKRQMNRKRSRTFG